MQTVKILKKVNIVFLVLILLMAMATVVFGQQQQNYGDSSLVEIELSRTADYLDHYIANDSVLLDIISIAHYDDAPSDTIHLDPKSLDWSALDNEYEESQHDLFFVTADGITSLVTIMEKKKVYVIVNGKLQITFKGKRIIDNDRPEDYFKDKIKWAYNQK